MTNVGILGLDTTHPETMARNLEKMDRPTINALWDSGDMRDRDHAEEFARRYDATLFDEPHELIGEVDGVLILTINWDRHFELAKLFVESGIPVLLDKPILGTIDEVDQLRELSRMHETAVCGGSALPYHPSIQAVPAGEDSRTVFGVGYGPPNAANLTHTFLYGPHVVDPASELIRSPWEHVRPWSGPDRSVIVEFENGSHAIFQFDGPQTDPKFAYIDVAERTSTVVIDELLPEGDEAVRDEIYTAYLEAFVDAIAAPYAEPTRLFDGAELLVAAYGALDGNRALTRGDAALTDVHLSGQTFLDSYEPYWMTGEYADRY